jgi:hypothetical protein
MRSAMCAAGSHEMSRLPGSSGMISSIAAAETMML